MVILDKIVINHLKDRPDLLCRWMHNLNELREVLILIFIEHDIHGWQGLSVALSKSNVQFKIKDLIVFYSRYELDEVLLNTLLEFSLKLKK